MVGTPLVLAHALLALSNFVGAFYVPLTADNVTAVEDPSHTNKDWLILYSDDTVSQDIVDGFNEAAAKPYSALMSYSILDCKSADFKPVCQRHNVTDVPDVRYFRSGEPFKYHWTMDEAGFYGIGHKITQDPVWSLQQDKIFHRFKNERDLSFMLWFYPQAHDDAHLHKAYIYNSVATQYRHEPIFFAQAARVDLREQERIRFQDLPIVRQYGLDEAYDYNITNWDEDSLKQFIDDHKFGQLCELGPARWEWIHDELTNKAKILMISFIDVSVQSQIAKYVNSLRVMAWDFRIAKNYNFQMAYLDAKKYPELAKVYGVENTPALVAIDFREHKKVIRAPAAMDPGSRKDLLRWTMELWMKREKSSFDEMPPPPQPPAETHEPEQTKTTAQDPPEKATTSPQQPIEVPSLDQSELVKFGVAFGASLVVLLLGMKMCTGGSAPPPPPAAGKKKSKKE